MRGFLDVFRIEVRYACITFGRVNVEMTNHTAALLIGQPGSLRDGLQVLLKSVSNIEAIFRMDNIRSALAFDIDHLITLIFVVKNPSDNDFSPSLNHIKNKWPQARIVILVDDEHQCQLLQGADCDLILIKGYPAANLTAAIERLLSQEMGKETHL